MSSYNLTDKLLKSEDVLDAKVVQLAREVHQLRERQNTHAQRLCGFNRALEDLGEEISLIRRRLLEIMPALDVPQSNVGGEKKQ